MKTIILLSVCLLTTFSSFSQLNLPNASPDAEFKQQVGFSEIEVKYSRPSARGRTIFGELVPFGELWRTGAHDATTIRFSDTVKVNDNVIPSGTYSLFTIPNQNEWTIILNKTTEMHGTSDYTQEKDLVRFVVKPEKSARFYETFTIEVNDIVKNTATLYMAWENTQVSFTIKTFADEKVMAEINDRINVKKEDRASLFYQSSLYYFNNGKDLNKALEWIRTANSKSQDAMYLQLQGKIQAAIGDYSGAIKVLGASSELAKSKKLDQIVAANDKLVHEWNKKSSRK